MQIFRAAHKRCTIRSTESWELSLASALLSVFDLFIFLYFNIQERHNCSEWSHPCCSVAILDDRRRRIKSMVDIIDLSYAFLLFNLFEQTIINSPKQHNDLFCLNFNLISTFCNDLVMFQLFSCLDVKDNGRQVIGI